MRLFRRKQQTTTMPAEVAEYYQAERRDRRSVKWLITLFSLLATIAIVIGLFLAGRWLYRTIKGSDAPQTATTQTQTQSSSDSQAANGSSSDTQDNSKSADNSSDSSSDSNVSSPGSSSKDNSSTDQGSTNGSSSDSGSSRNADNAQNTDDTGTGATGSSDGLTNTGPGETTAIVFVGASALGYALYRRRLVRG